jgi:hypothetical protein
MGLAARSAPTEFWLGGFLRPKVENTLLENASCIHVENTLLENASCIHVENAFGKHST